MKEFDFERDAMAGKPCPKKMNIVDTCVYISLKNLYAMYKAGLISRKDAQEEKKTLIYNSTMWYSMLEFLDRENKSVAQKMSATAEEYRKNPTIENAEKFFAAFYNLPENWRETYG